MQHEYKVQMQHMQQQGEPCLTIKQNPWACALQEINRQQQTHCQALEHKVAQSKQQQEQQQVRVQARCSAGLLAVHAITWAATAGLGFNWVNKPDLLLQSLHNNRAWQLQCLEHSRPTGKIPQDTSSCGVAMLKEQALVRMCLQVFVASLQQQLAESQSIKQPPPAAAAAAAQAPSEQGNSIQDSAKTLQQGTSTTPGSSCHISTAANQAAAQSSIAAAAPEATMNQSVNTGGSSDDKAAHEVAALHLMEGQLVRLSGIIKSHQEEIAQLRQALMASCAERQQLLQQLQQQQQSGTLEAASAAACSARGAGSATAVGSIAAQKVAAGAAAARGRVPAAAAVVRSTSKNVRRT
jgi:hypothetical protein